MSAAARVKPRMKLFEYWRNPSGDTRTQVTDILGSDYEEIFEEEGAISVSPTISWITGKALNSSLVRIREGNADRCNHTRYGH